MLEEGWFLVAQFCASSSSENRNVLSEEVVCAFSNALRTWRGEAGDTLSTHERLEKREDDDEGRLKLRMPAGAGEDAKSLSTGVSARGAS